MRAADTSSANASRWYSGVIPAADNIAVIARVFGVSTDEIYRVINGEESSAPRSRAAIRAELDANEPIEIPLIKDLVAHMGAGGGFVDDYVYLSPSFRRRSHRNIRAIRAHGDCMLPAIEDGDVVIFDMEAHYKPNDVVVANADGHAVVRRLMEVGGRMVLRADATGDTHVLTEDDQIYGKVIATQRSFGVA